MNLVSCMIGKKEIVAAADVKRGAGFNIYMCIKHEHSIIILLSFLFMSIEGMIFEYEHIFFKDNCLEMASNGAIQNFFSTSFMIFHNLFLQCTWFVIGSQACNLMHYFL